MCGRVDTPPGLTPGGGGGGGADGHAEVCQFDGGQEMGAALQFGAAFGEGVFQQNVFGLQVAVHNGIRMYVLDGPWGAGGGNGMRRGHTAGVERGRSTREASGWDRKSGRRGAWGFGHAVWPRRPSACLGLHDGGRE